jgi:signal transduction histidine kinase
MIVLKSSKHSRIRGYKQAIRITAIYFVIGCLWILFSDKLTGALFDNKSAVLVASMLKGWLYVLVTSALLFVLISGSIRRLKKTNDELLASRDLLRSMHEFDLAILKGFSSFSSIGENAIHYMLDLLKPDIAAIGVLGLDNDIMYVSSICRGSEDLTVYEKNISPGELSQLAAVCRQPNACLGDTPPPSVVTDIFKCTGGCSCYSIPIYSGDKLRGIISLGFTPPRAPNENNLDTVNDMMTQIALAVEQRRLVMVTERYATDLEDMVDERTQQLQAAVKELEAFTYSVSHDLRAPLRSMGGFVNILLEDFGDRLDEEGRRLCGVISDSARHLGKLIDDLLALSRIGRASMVFLPMNMEDMVRSLFQELTSDSQRDRIEFSVGSLPVATCDPTLIRQVWQNLLDNAIKYSSKKPRAIIRVEGKLSGGDVVYSVTDNGAGFDMNYRDKLFGVFERLHSQREFEGTGIGLAIVQRIIHRHGGKVWAEAEVDKGASFYFTLSKDAADTQINA